MFERAKRFFTQSKQPRVAIIQFDSYPATDKIRSAFITALQNEIGNKPSFQSFVGNGDKQLLKSKIETVLQDSFDLIFSIGTYSTVLTHQLSSDYEATPPLVFTDVHDPLRLHIISSYAHSNNNVTGVVLPGGYYDERINHLLQLQPYIERALVVYDYEQERALPADELKHVLHFFEQSNVTVEQVGLNHKNEAGTLLDHVLSNSDPQVIFALRHESVMAAMPQLITCANKHQIPLYSSDLESVELGAAVGCGFNEVELGQKSASKAAILLRQKAPASNMPITLHAEPFSLLANKWSMEKQGLRLSDRGINWLTRHGRFV